MTTLDNGIVIDESKSSVHFTPNHLAVAAFGMPRNITGVTIHHWGADGQTFDNVERELIRNSRSVSAHFNLQEDRVSCLVSTPDVAWHSGNGVGNVSTIGIECRPEMTAGDLKTLASLIRHLESMYGSLLIYTHADWTATACPGRYAGKVGEIVSMVNAPVSGHCSKSNCTCNC